ncbi:MAG: hypothetical protein AAGI01_08265 [Myxococcota bacterium]
MHDIRSLHVSLGGVSIDELSGVLDAFEEAQVFTLPATSYLLDEPPAYSAPNLVALTLDAPDVSWAMAAADTLHHRGAHALLTLPSTDHALLSYDVRALLGLGVALGSSGTSGAPLVGMPLGDLRSTLATSRDTMSRACGYSVCALRPTPTPLGRAIDPMVLEEAVRAGYTLVLRPSHDVLAWRIEPVRGIRVLAQRVWTRRDHPSSITTWFGDERLSRGRLGDALGQAMRHGRRTLSTLWRGSGSPRGE